MSGYSLVLNVSLRHLFIDQNMNSFVGVVTSCGLAFIFHFIFGIKVLAHTACPNVSPVNTTCACSQTLSTALENSFTLDRKLEDVLEITELLINDCLGENVFTACRTNYLHASKKECVLISGRFIKEAQIPWFRLV